MKICNQRSLISGIGLSGLAVAGTAGIDTSAEVHYQSSVANSLCITLTVEKVMTKKEVPAALKTRIEHANANGEGYKIPESYNNIWRKAAEELTKKGVAKETKGKGKNSGLWLKKK